MRYIQLLIKGLNVTSYFKTKNLVDAFICKLAGGMMDSFLSMMTGGMTTTAQAGGLTSKLVNIVIQNFTAK